VFHVVRKVDEGRRGQMHLADTGLCFRGSEFDSRAGPRATSRSCFVTFTLPAARSMSCLWSARISEARKVPTLGESRTEAGFPALPLPESARRNSPYPNRSDSIATHTYTHTAKVMLHTATKQTNQPKTQKRQRPERPQHKRGLTLVALSRRGACRCAAVSSKPRASP